MRPKGKKSTNIQLYDRDRKHADYIASKMALSTRVAVIRYALWYLATVLQQEEKQEGNKDDVNS